MAKKTLILLVGETGCGKDTVANKLPYHKVVSYKTGPMRSSDVEGVSHIFVSEKEMDQLEKRDDIIAWIKTGDIRYCATMDQLNSDISIYIINPDGVRWLNKHCKNYDTNIIIIGLYSSLIVRQNRCMARGDSITSFKNRVMAEQNDYNIFRLNGEFDYLINNKNSNTSASIIRRICDELL